MPFGRLFTSSFLFYSSNAMVSFIKDRFFLIRGLSWIGKISFSLYLIHFPLFKLFGYLHQRDLRGETRQLSHFLLYILPVILFAWLFFKCVEDPIHQWSKKKSWDRRSFKRFVVSHPTGNTFVQCTA